MESKEDKSSEEETYITAPTGLYSGIDETPSTSASGNEDVHLSDEDPSVIVDGSALKDFERDKSTSENVNKDSDENHSTGDGETENESEECNNLVNTSTILLTLCIHGLDNGMTTNSIADFLGFYFTDYLPCTKKIIVDRVEKIVNENSQKFVTRYSKIFASPVHSASQAGTSQTAAYQGKGKGKGKKTLTKVAAQNDPPEGTSMGHSQQQQSTDLENQISSGSLGSRTQEHRGLKRKAEEGSDQAEHKRTKKDGETEN